MAGTAPDETALFETNDAGGIATGAALVALLGTASGQKLRVASEHWIPKAGIGDDGFAAVVSAAYASKTEIEYCAAELLLSRVIDISNLGSEAANFVFNPAFLSQVLMDCLTAGGLSRTRYANFGEACVAVSAAGKTMPKIKATTADITQLPATTAAAGAASTRKWLDEATTRDFTGPDGTARSGAPAARATPRGAPRAGGPGGGTRGTCLAPRLCTPVLSG